MKKFFLLCILFIGTILPFAPAQALEHYSFEHAEELKPLINWQEYGPDAFAQAIEENKPVFLFLTAPSWCYWCQVYESEEYLFDPEVIEVMNNNFIPVYVDADKRQDLTRQYLEGGWPSSTIFTPSNERIYGFSGVRPPKNMVANMMNAVKYVNDTGFSNAGTINYTERAPVIPTESNLRNMIAAFQGSLTGAFDPVYGGFGNGQKFPQPRSLDFALDLYEQTGKKEWLEMVQKTIEGQYTNIDEIETAYHLYDPVEGGFHRYTTKRDWTVPHYEKMLYDNARLLKTYAHLQQLVPDDPIINEVVSGTKAYIERKFLDENGGFYGDSDAFEEEEYFGKNPRPEEQPRIEKTKFSDWNTDAILTYLYLAEIWKDPADEEIARKALDFFMEEMITDEGAYHYKDANGEKGVRGSLADNASLMMAFMEGYAYFGDKKYLEVAKELAEYVLERNYDWKSGGFFDRNSPDIELYAPGENILVEKTLQENGIAAYVFAQLAVETEDIRYLNAAVQTTGSFLGSTYGSDRSYYMIQAAQVILENNLLDTYASESTAIAALQEKERRNFWLDAYLPKEVEPVAFVSSNEGIAPLEGPLLLLLLIALVAGFISFVSPCTLPILPAYLAGVFSRKEKYHVGSTIAFFLGLSAVFTVLGMTSTFVGAFLKDQISIFSQIAGVILILFGIYILTGKGLPGVQIKNKKPTTLLGSFFFGSAIGISWTPCVGPILVAILILASTASSVFTGGVLLFAYSVGLAIPLLTVSYFSSRLNKNSRFWKILRGKEIIFSVGKRKIQIHSSTLIAGALFIILGVLMFSGLLYTFNQIVGTTAFQKGIYDIEEMLLRLVS